MLSYFSALKYHRKEGSAEKPGPSPSGIDRRGNRIMVERSWTVRQVVEMLEVDEAFIDDLVDEEILCPACHMDPLERLFTEVELEKLWLAKVLVEDLGVNLAGVDVILDMRRKMIEMRRQFDAILEDLANRFRESRR
jgi:MerR family transcriptional regulator/heat shock protein HspR